MSNDDSPRLIPTGKCWCGCNRDTSLGSFFARGHDKMAEAAILALKYEGSVARLLDEHGFGPDNSLKAEALAREVWKQCPYCDYAGAPASIRNHISKDHKEGQ
ncbi:hypothetical protein ACWELB_21280 [Streptomyces asiaticus]